MSKKDMHLKNTNEDGMTSQVTLDWLNKTKVNFGYFWRKKIYYTLEKSTLIDIEETGKKNEK